MVNADHWAEHVVPGSDLTVERYETTRPVGEATAVVTMVMRVRAVDAARAEEAVRHLLEEAMPVVEFTGVSAKPIVGRYIENTDGEPTCSFCGKLPEQVKKLIAGPGVYVCDECVAMMSEIIEDDAPSPDP
jgi:ClpX C4-type zinc finger